jgi:hypothetical protein
MDDQGSQGGAKRGTDPERGPFLPKTIVDKTQAQVLNLIGTGLCLLAFAGCSSQVPPSRVNDVTAIAGATPSGVATSWSSTDPTPNITVTVPDQNTSEDRDLIVEVLPTSNANTILSAIWVSSTEIVIARPGESSLAWSKYDTRTQEWEVLATSPLLGSGIYTTLGVDEPAGRMEIPDLSAEVVGLIAPSGERALSWGQSGDCTGPGGRTEITMHTLVQHEDPKQTEIETCGVLTQAAWTRAENAVILGLVMEYGETVYRWDFSSGLIEGVVTQSGEAAITEYGWSFDPENSQLALITLERDLLLVSPFGDPADSMTLAVQVVGAPAFSSDGRYILFWQKPGDLDAPLNLVQLDLASGGHRVLIADNPEWERDVYGERKIASSADSRYVALYGYGLSIVEVP